MDKNTLDNRNERVINFFKNPKVIFPIILILLVILGMYIRVLPMTAHGINPGLWDISTNDWTLGPDLDPWSFVRQAKNIAQNGGIQATDPFRNVPLGVDNSRETILLPYMIYGTYQVVNLFRETFGFSSSISGDFNMEFAGALFPVLMFGLTIIVFFLFVKEIFISKGITQSNIIASISTFFFITIPVLLPRTIAGIPEKESAGFLFMFLSLLLFLKSIKSEEGFTLTPKAREIKTSIFYGTLAGISTALMRFVWGGAIYIFATIFLAMLLAFLFNKVNLKYYLSYTSWLIASFTIMILFSNWFSLISLLTLSYTSICILLWLFLTLHFILWNTNISNNNILQYLNLKMPKNIVSIIVTLIILIPLSLIIFGPQFIYEKLQIIYELLFNPITGRWNTTVAENRPPFLMEWVRSFGPFIERIPLMFTLFITGSIIFFKEMFNKLESKTSVRITIVYIILLTGIIFSRISASSIFNGHNFISQLFFIGSIIFFISSLLYCSIKYKNIFTKIKFEYILLFSLFILCLITVRGAIRLTMVLASVAPIFVGYFLVKLFYLVKTYKAPVIKKEDDTGIAKILTISLCLIVVVSSIFTGYAFYQTTTTQSYNFVPNYYNIQWQNAMSWVRDNTDTTSVFAHWWDYGYWIQAIGERATVTDGGNVITYWNYLMGRHVLTGNNQNNALEFLYNHNTDYLLIDSSDIGKYGAYSSIGSNKNYDRFSTIPTLLMDATQTKETLEINSFFYKGGTMLDDDIIYEHNKTKYFFPQSQSAIYGIVVITDKNNSVKKVDILVFNKGTITSLPLRYCQYNNNYYDFGYGLNGTVKIIPRVNNNGQLYNNGALIYISPRVTKTLFSHLYLLDNPANKFSNFKISHIEPNIFTQSNEIFFYDPIGIIGPIKIWSVEYSGKEQLKKEYIDTDPTKYLDWKL